MSTKSRLALWEEMLASGGADGLFRSYPDDVELAAKLNGLFEGGEEITEEVVRKDRNRFHLLPRRGELHDQKIASPTKYVIYNKARQLSVNEAIAEILDNIFDNFERNVTKPSELTISVTAYPATETANGEIVIRENSGGIPEGRIGPLIQLGASARSEGGIGAWGEGFKMAVFALGGEVEVFSSFSGEEPKAIHFPKNWLEPTNIALWTQWKVEIFKIGSNPPPDGSTIIRINSLHPQVLSALGLAVDSIAAEETVADGMSAYFGEIYSEKFHRLQAQGHKISISLTIGQANEDVVFFKPIEERLKENLAFLPWLRPIKWEREFSTQLAQEGREARLKMTIYAGLAAFDKYSPTYADDLSQPGVEMWGNGRKFSLQSRIKDESVGWGYSYAGSGGTNPSSNSSYRRLTLVAVFDAEDSRDIPWAAPVKNDYNRRSEFYAEIQAALAWSIKLFKNVHNLLEFVQIVYSARWENLSDNEKLEVLFSDVEPDEKSVRSFAKSRFGRKLMLFKPDLSFKTISKKQNEPTVHHLFGVLPTNVTDIVKAAQVTKQSVEQRTDFLKALFNSLSLQCEIEEKLGLSDNEEIKL